MTDLTPDHPAVEAASKAWAESHPTVAATWAKVSDRLQGITRARMAAALSAALSHLTADDLRDTPAGRELMAEGWDQGWRDRKQYDQDIDWRTIPVTDTNPYLEADA